MRSPAVILLLGITAVVLAAAAMAVLWPVHMQHEMPSDQWRPLTPLEAKGRLVYIRNGCVYCHSQYLRPQDWNAERVAEAGDYYKQSPQLLGTEQTGPDLSQEGGEHSNDWHLAHFIDPRYTRPRSLMPRFEFEGDANIKALTAYVQSLGGKNADARMAVQNRFHSEANRCLSQEPGRQH